MPILTIYDTSLFCSIVKSLTNTTTISFKITQDVFCIFSHSTAQYYISIPNTYYKITESKQFSVHTASLINFVDLLQKQVTINLTHSFFVEQEINKTQICIDIPFISYVDFVQQELSDIETKFLIKNSKMKIPFTGIVTYKNHNNNLIVKREGEEANEEIVIYDIDYIENKKLDFTCSNAWLQILILLENEYEDVLFSFCEYFLSVQFIFTKHNNSFFEIQVPRALIL
ncbi:hypothetical protein BDAP_002060 [Binucleata daphniae]